MVEISAQKDLEIKPFFSFFIRDTFHEGYVVGALMGQRLAD